MKFVSVLFLAVLFTFLNALETQERTKDWKSIKVLSLNVFVRPPRVIGCEFKDERLKILLDRIVDFDIVCLQEMFRCFSKRQKKFIAKAEKLGFLYHERCPRPKLFSVKLVDGGLLILSRFPLNSFKFHPFQTSFLPDRLAQKGIIHTTVSVSHNANFHLLVTHMDDGKGRTAQAIELKQFMRDELSLHAPVLLVGDFNTDSRNHPEDFKFLVKNLKQIGIGNPHDLTLKLNGDHPDTFIGQSELNAPHDLSNPKLIPPSVDLAPLDYMFFFPVNVSMSAKIKVVDDKASINEFKVDTRTSGGKFTRLSDHFGVTTELSVRETYYYQRYEFDEAYESS
eukprot:1012074_1